MNVLKVLAESTIHFFLVILSNKSDVHFELMMPFTWKSRTLDVLKFVWWRNSDHIEVFASICICDLHICVNWIPGMCVCVGRRQELCVFFLGGSHVRFGLQGTDPHSCMSKPIFNLNSFMAFHLGLSDQTGLWILQHSYGQKRVVVITVSYLKHLSLLFKQKHYIVTLFLLHVNMIRIVYMCSKHTKTLPLTNK